ncbi:hypothetical protein [Synechocystis sp. LKSZ1]|uniref:hypothetical protein n=1 Tax=Synechocystis sp. LKSZ1 TaxID=3144951 RepID=UPI00336C2C38
MKIRYLSLLIPVGLALAIFPLVAKEISPVPEDPSLIVSPPGPVATFSDRPTIQIAILLDSSNSMDGLIEQTRTQIWKIVNALANVTKDGKTPVLEVALYHYGNNTLPSAEGFNRLMNPLSPELDQVSEKLFSITTDGGQEYAGWVIESATAQLDWDRNPDNFRAMFIAGNEPFDQGRVSWQTAIGQARQKDIVINTIYCGTAENSESRLWAEGADSGQGSYFNINQDQAVVDIPTPYDPKIEQLNQQLNQTYIPYGHSGEAGQQRQLAEDQNAASRGSSGAALNRAQAKSSAYYRNSSWDLLDALADQTVKLNELSKEELPEAMRSMSANEQRQYLETKQTERARLQAQITELGQKRADYLRQQASSTASANTLEVVMIEALRKQLAAKGFVLN